MATDDNNKLPVDLATLLYELRMGVEASMQSFNRFTTMPAATALLGEFAAKLRFHEEEAEKLLGLDLEHEAFLKRHAEGGANA